MTNPRTSRQYNPPVTITLEGATAPDGKPYIRIAASGRHAWIARDAFTGSGSEALRILKAANIPLLPDEWTQCREKVAELKSYPPKLLIDRRGWNGPHYALADASVFSASEEQPVVLFLKDSQKCAAAGSIGAWRRITALLRDQPIATFVLLAAYAGPFLSLSNLVHNPGFELAGPGGVGKSTIQRLAAAVCGPPEDYLITGNATINGLERLMAEHSDMPLIIEELNLIAAGAHPATRAAKIKELVFRLAEGTEKLRFNTDRARRARFVFSASTNEPLAQLLLEHRVAVVDAATDRLITIPIDSGRPHGVFDCLPEGFANSGELADYLNAEIRRCHGVGIRKLLSRLVIDMAERPEWVTTQLGSYMTRFRQRARVLGNDGSENRVADAFGLVYAAGKFAVHYQAVSPQLKPLQAVLKCYQLNRASQVRPASPVRELCKLVDPWDGLRVKYDNLKQLSEGEIEQADAILREGKGGRFELLLTDRQLHRAFPNSRAFFADPEIRRRMVTEEGRMQVKRQIRSNHKPERFYCFRVDDWV